MNKKNIKYWVSKIQVVSYVANEGGETCKIFSNEKGYNQICNALYFK
jgi:hypothetical protein